MVVVGTQTDFNRFQLKMTQTSKKSLLVTTKTSLKERLNDNFQGKCTAFQVSM